VTLEGLTPFADAWALQRRLVAARQQAAIPDVVLLLQHLPVVTLGRSGDRGHLLLSPEVLRQRGVEVYQIERGGGATYHGPGQLVAYPILDLRAMDEDVVRFMRALEESVIRTVADFGIVAGRLRGFPGVWAGEAKLAAVGVAVKRRVTMHGVALNVTTDLEPFTWINPCGLNRPVTSMARLLGREVSFAAVADAYARRFAEVYALAFVPVGRPQVEERLAALAAQAVVS
jgi:lipoate-protein ligase B